jgi:hypothetical protein
MPLARVSELVAGRNRPALSSEDDADDPVMDGGYVVGFYEAVWPQPTDNSRWVWAFDVPDVERQPSKVTVQLGFTPSTGRVSPFTRS